MDMKEVDVYSRFELERAEPQYRVAITNYRNLYRDYPRHYTHSELRGSDHIRT